MFFWSLLFVFVCCHWFKAHGGLTRENGQHFRDTVLSKGATQDYGVMFRNFTGHDPSPTPLLEDVGLVAAEKYRNPHPTSASEHARKPAYPSPVNGRRFALSDSFSH